TRLGSLDDTVLDAEPQTTDSSESTAASDEPLVIDWDISPAAEPQVGRAEETDNSGTDDGLTFVELDLPAPPARARSDVGGFDLIELEPELTPADEAEEEQTPPPVTTAKPPRRPTAAIPTPSIARRATAVAERSVELLRAGVVAEPQRWALRRELGEAMLEAGDRAGGIRELETSMSGAEAAGDLDLAAALAEEVARLEPDQPRHHRKRVEYAFRMNDRGGLIEAYLSLADALLRADQPDKARTIYQRVVELAPDEVRAHTALETL